jgi:hypothetical protein
MPGRRSRNPEPGQGWLAKSWDSSSYFGAVIISVMCQGASASQGKVQLECDPMYLIENAAQASFASDVVFQRFE